MDVVARQLTVLVEDIGGDQSLNLVESYYHAFPFIGVLESEARLKEALGCLKRETLPFIALGMLPE